MARQKLIRFDFNNQSPRIIQPGKPEFETIKGNWNKHFGNENPLVFELGCGRGEYTTGLAAQYPDRNFVGVDLKGNRIWKGATVADEENLPNVAFLRTHIHNIGDFVAENEVSEIWVTFPDPRPKTIDEKRRLTSHRYIYIYKKIMKEGGMFHFKTDDLPLFEYSLEVLAEFNVKDLVYTKNLYQSPMLDEHFGIRTTYEKKFSEKGRDINYLRCIL